MQEPVEPVYYNEYDPYAAQWLRNLIKAGQIAPGIVDERSILDVCPRDLRGFRQHHFFAGVGVWSYALRRAGWADSRAVWSGSCPCQPFSAAGLGAGFDDERHLWPVFYHLFEQHVAWLREQERDVPVIFGEQVASKAVDAWVDLVQADLEAMGYAFGAVPFPAASVGAPHIRDRTYWVADPDGGGWARTEGGVLIAHRSNGGLGHPHHQGLERQRGGHQTKGGRLGAAGPVATAGESGGLANTDHGGRLGRWSSEAGDGRDAARVESERLRNAGWLADADGGHASAERQQRGGEQRQQPEDGRLVQARPAGPTNGFWSAADWLNCRDGKWRPVEPGTFPLAHGATSRVGRLRAYGNAINAEQAQVFIECFLG